MSDPVTPPAAPAATTPAAAIPPAVAPIAPVQPAAPAAAALPTDPPKPAEPAAPAEIKYEAFKLPEGIALDAAVMGDFEKIAKDAKLPQAQAQALVDLGAKMTQGFQAQADAAVEKAKTDWEAAGRKDSEIGGAKFDGNVALANNVFREFGTPALGDFLKQTGLGNHPELVRWAQRVAKAVGEDRFTRGNPPGGPPAGQSLDDRAATKLYGSAS